MPRRRCGARRAPARGWSESASPANASSGAAVLAVVPRFGDERLEEPQVLAGLGVPEDAEGEATRGVLEPLERAVFRVRRLAQALAEPAEPLVVVRLHRRVVAEQRRQPAFGDELHVVVGVRARGVLVLVVADDVGQVLDEIAAEGDV